MALTKKIVLLAVTVFFALSAFAATSKEVSYRSEDETVHGYLFTPSGNGPFPALVAIHEWWGLNDWVKEQASKLADEGYVTLPLICIVEESPPRRKRPTKSCAACRKTALLATF